MNSFRMAVAAVCLAVMGGFAAVYLLPSRSEMGAIYLKAARYSDARPYYQQRYKAGDRSTETIAGLAWLFQSDARVDRVIALYEDHARRRPQDTEVRRRLEWLYKETQRTHDYARALRRRVDDHADPGGRRKLARLYWRLGRYDAWAGQMARLVGSSAIRPQEALRYARYLAVRGKSAKASAVLARHLLAVKPGKIPVAVARHGGRLAIGLMLDRGDRKGAMAAARVLIEHVATPDFRLRIVDLFEARKHRALAMALLDPGAGAYRLNRKLLRRLTWLEHAAGKRLRAFKRLDRLARAGRLHRQDTDLLVTMAVATKRLERAWGALQAAGLRSLPRGTVVRFAIAALEANQTRLARRVVARLGPDFARREPLIAAHVAMAQGDLRAARGWTLKAIAAGALPTRLAVNIARKLFRAGDRTIVGKLIARILQRPAPDDASLVDIVSMAVRIGQSVPARKWLAAARSRTAGSPWPRLAGLFLKTRVSPAMLAAAVPAQAPKAARLAMLRAVHEAAAATGHEPLMNAALGRLVALAPATRDRLVLAQAYSRSKKPLQALATLRPHLGKSSRIDEQYAIALVRAARASHAIAPALKHFLPRWLGRRDVSLRRRRVIVDDLVALGKAKLVVAALARAAGGGDVTGNVGELLVVALMGAGKIEEARAIIGKMIAGTQAGGTLARYAQLAEQAGALKAAKAALRRLLERDPNNPKLVKRLAFVAYWSEEYDLARRLWTRYTGQRSGDWQALYRLGEVVSKFPDWRSANASYRRALAVIESLKRPPPAARRARAHLLYRLARFDDSVRAHEVLLRRAPQDKETRRQYLRVLFALGRYREFDRVKVGGSAQPRRRRTAEVRR